jgi:hypothetical protein
VSFYFIKEGEAMRFEDHLTKEQKQQLRNIQHSTTKSKTKQKKKECFSRKDLEELMGLHMDTYTRRNGAWRRK